jgi:hypothetical protein
LNTNYSKHFLERQALRVLPEGIAEKVFHEADEHFFDASTSTFVAVKNLCFQGTERDIEGGAKL